MGPVDWLGVVVAVFVAGAVAVVWYGPLFGRAKLMEVGPGKLQMRRNPLGTAALTGGLLFLTAAMMGHMFARVGDATLAAKPWLYFMMSGGLALAFVVPALIVSYNHQRITGRLAAIDAGFWLAAYLGMGLAFRLA